MKFLYTLSIFFLLNFTVAGRPVKVMLITGGHAYDTLQFFSLFDSLDDVEYTHFIQPEANKAISEGVAEAFDILVFYDMWQDIKKAEQETYIRLTRQGKPFLFLHHALVSYQHWPDFEKLLGGRYVENTELDEGKQSTYKHDVWVDVEVVDNNHPVTRGLNNFKIYDEVYGNYRVLPQVKPLLKTSHPQSIATIGWEHKYNKSTVLYLQPGHDKNAYMSENYRRLIHQAIIYLAEQ